MYHLGTFMEVINPSISGETCLPFRIASIVLNDIDGSPPWLMRNVMMSSRRHITSESVAVPFFIKS